MANLVPSEKDLISSINQKMPDMIITIQDLKQPTSDFVTRYFTRTLEEFSSQEINLNHIPFSHLKEYITNSPTINLYFALEHIYKKLFVDNFSIRDLIEPNYKRTLTLIHTFDNFHNYANGVMNEVDDIVKDHQNLEERSKDLENLIEQYIISNNEKTSHRAQLQNSLKEITQKNNKSLEKKKELLSEKKNFEMIEKSKSMKVEELNRIKESYEQMCNQNKDLKNRIMPMKNEIDSTLAELNQKLNEMVQLTKDFLSNIQKEKNSLNKNKNNLKLYQTLTINIKNFLENWKANSLVNQDLKDFNSSVIQAEILSLTKDYNLLQEEISAFHNQTNKKNNSLLEYFKDIVMTGNNSKTKVNELKEREKLIDLPSLKKNYDTIYDQVKSESDSFKSMWISSIKEGEKNKKSLKNHLNKLSKDYFE